MNYIQIRVYFTGKIEVYYRMREFPNAPVHTFRNWSDFFAWTNLELDSNAIFFNTSIRVTR